MAGRSFLVTGCASGIGQNLADAIVAAGDRLLATDLDLVALDTHATAAGWPRDRVQWRRLDVTSVEDWNEAIEATRPDGPLDVVVNMAGFLRPSWVHELDEEDIDRHLAVNVRGVVLGTRAASRAMLPHGQGHIVNVASLAALAPIPGLSLYSASKFAVRAFSLAAAQELRPRGVAVTVVCPDAVKTPMLDLQRDYEEAALTFSGRPLEPQAVSDAILGPVLKKRPFELFLPPGRGWLARAADIFPRATAGLGPILRRRGRSRQRGLGE